MREFRNECAEVDTDNREAHSKQILAHLALNGYVYEETDVDNKDANVVKWSSQGACWLSKNFNGSPFYNPVLVRLPFSTKEEDKYPNKVLDSINDSVGGQGRIYTQADVDKLKDEYYNKGWRNGVSTEFDIQPKVLEINAALAAAKEEGRKEEREERQLDMDKANAEFYNKGREEGRQTNLSSVIRVINSLK